MDEKKAVTADDVWRMDAAAFNPKPTGYVKLLNDIEYPMYSFMDIPTKDSLDVLSASDKLNELAAEERMKESRRIILMLNAGPAGVLSAKPGELIPEAELDRLSLRQVVTLTTLALTVSQVPLKAGEGESKESPSSAPASAASTGGTTSA